MTVWTCLTMISLAMVAGQSSTILFTLSLSSVSSWRMNVRASSAVFIFRVVWMENSGEPNASCQMKVLISFQMTKVINLIEFNLHRNVLELGKFKQYCRKETFVSSDFPRDRYIFLIHLSNRNCVFVLSTDLFQVKFHKFKDTSFAFASFAPKNIWKALKMFVIFLTFGMFSYIFCSRYIPSDDWKMYMIDLQS